MKQNRRWGRLAITGLAGFSLMAALGISLPDTASASPESSLKQKATTLPATANSSAGYLVGTGMSDITGAIAEAGAFGYASGQEMKGLQQRLYAHAFVVAQPDTGQRVAYVSMDTGAVFSSVRLRVLEKLENLYGGLYNSGNVMLGITHTHVGPGGSSTDRLYEIAAGDGMSYGFSQQVLDTAVNGVVDAIAKADKNLEPGSIAVKRGDVRGITKNRSLPAYQANPDAALYEDSIDPTMIQLEFSAASGEKLGVFNWFSTHPTSFPIDWDLYSGDNKGYAQYLFEQKLGTDPAEDKTFVAAFPVSATGDIVPAPGNSCSTSEFKGTDDDFYNTELHGKQQFDAAWELWNSAGTQVAGPVDSRGRYAQFKGYQVGEEFTDGAGAQTLCIPARGFSFAAGGENGPSNIPGIYEGMTKDNFSIDDAVNQVDTSALGGLVRLAFAAVGSFGQDPCQAEKPVVLPDGAWGWSSTVLPVQILRIGNVAIMGAPVETGVMGVRHLRAQMEEALAPLGIDTVIFQGAANDYAGYVSTRHEYAAQHYEGASTEFGPYELAAFQQEFAGLAEALKEGTPVTDDTRPAIVNTKYKANRPGVVLDDKPLREEFGQVLVQPQAVYARGEVAAATFRAGHPKNNIRVGGTFLVVQRQEADGTWVDYLTDRDWNTIYRWEREGASYSRATVEWRIPADAPAGAYRMMQTGDWKNGWTRKITPYTGISNPFVVE